METAIATVIIAGLKIWAEHKGKPAGWIPTAEDWAELEAATDKTAADYKREATEATE